MAELFDFALSVSRAEAKRLQEEKQPHQPSYRRFSRLDESGETYREDVSAEMLALHDRAEARAINNGFN